MELSKLENFYKTQSKFYDLTRPFFLFSRERALSMLEVNEDDKVLDLACGTGLNIPYLSKRVSWKNIIGIDYSKSMLEKAKAKFPEIEFIRGDVSTFSLDEKFDKIVCTYSLSMIERWKETINNVRRHLNQDGTFLILDFNTWSSLTLPYFVFRKWLRMHGVDSEKDYVPELLKNFREVRKDIINFGYNLIIIAEKPICFSSEKGGKNELLSK